MIDFISMFFPTVSFLELCLYDLNIANAKFNFNKTGAVEEIFNSRAKSNGSYPLDFIRKRKAETTI